MAFTPEERAEILEVVMEQTVTPNDIPQASSPSEMTGLPGIDLNGDYKMLPMADISDPQSITSQDLDIICV